MIRMTKKTTRKLPPANDWRARNIEDWNTTTFTEYLRDKHRELFGCEYVPFGGRWATEQGMIGRLIGTRTKEGTHSKATVKRFIDEAFESYKPTRDYPGTNFGFIYSYRRNILQRIEAEELAGNKAERSRKETPSLDELSDWL